MEAETETITPTEVMAEPRIEQPEVEAPLQDFEVTEPAQIETTLEKVMEPSIETLNASVIVEEAIIPAHPMEAPHAAQTEMVAEAQKPQPKPQQKQKTPVKKN